MNIIESLLKYFQQHDNEDKSAAPEGLCHVCWGYQEYDRKIRDIFKDKQVDVNNHQKSYTLIRDFVVNKIVGIKLAEDKVGSCPTCSNAEENGYEKQTT